MSRYEMQNEIPISLIKSNSNFCNGFISIKSIILIIIKLNRFKFLVIYLHPTIHNILFLFDLRNTVFISWINVIHISRLAVKQSENYLIFDKKSFLFSQLSFFITQIVRILHYNIFIFALSYIRSTEILLQSHV